jgi:hypothetical protein
VGEAEAGVLPGLGETLFEIAELSEHFYRETGECLPVEGYLRKAEITLGGKWDLFGHRSPPLCLFIRKPWLVLGN